MKPFDSTSVCPKCLYDNIGTSYHDERRRCWTTDTCYREQKPHIQRYCLRCSFSWAEAPLDQEAPDERACPTEPRELKEES